MKPYPDFIIGKPFCEEEHSCNDIFLRYYLEIQISNNNDDVLCIMMNPSVANSNESDDTIDKIMELLKTKTTFGVLKVVNLYPIYKSQSNMLAVTTIELKTTLGEDNYNKIMDNNFSKIFEQIIKTDNLILGWGDPPDGMSEKDYLNKATKVIEVLSYLKEKKLFVFDTDTWNSNLTNKGQPRHPGRNNLIGLAECKIGVSNRIYL